MSTKPTRRGKAALECGSPLPLSLKYPPFPIVMGQPITREEIIDGLRECYKQMVQMEREKDPTIVRYPDVEAVLDYIDQHGLPPKEAK